MGSAARRGPGSKNPYHYLRRNRRLAQLRRFPKDATNRRKWLKVCKASEKMLLSSSCICSRHFKAKDFDSGYWPKRRLLSTAVPSVPGEQAWKPSYVSVNNHETMNSFSPASSEFAVDPLKDFGQPEDFGESTSNRKSGFIIPEYLKEQIQIIEVFSDGRPNSRSARQSNVIKQEVDEDVEIIESIPATITPKQEFKILEVFSEASSTRNSAPESDHDVEIVEECSNLNTNSLPGSAQSQQRESKKMRPSSPSSPLEKKINPNRTSKSHNASWKRPKNKDIYLDETQKRINERLDALSHVLNGKRVEEDECDVYGRLLAKKLRKYPERLRDRIMYKIDGLLLDNSPYSDPQFLHLPSSTISAGNNVPGGNETLQNHSAPQNCYMQTHIPQAVDEIRIQERKVSKEVVKSDDVTNTVKT